MKQNYKDMLLESASGYMMPFPLEEKDNIQATLVFGEQNHPLTGEKFFTKELIFLLVINLSMPLPQVSSPVPDRMQFTTTIL